jgi:hypothetical protein
MVCVGVSRGTHGGQPLVERRRPLPAAGGQGGRCSLLLPTFPVKFRWGRCNRHAACYIRVAFPPGLAATLGRGRPCGIGKDREGRRLRPARWAWLTRSARSARAVSTGGAGCGRFARLTSCKRGFTFFGAASCPRLPGTSPEESGPHTSGSRPLPACPAGEAVRQASPGRPPLAPSDRCRLARQVKQFRRLAALALQPTNSFTCRASRQGSKRGGKGPSSSRRTPSPGRQAGRGRPPSMGEPL